MDDPIMGYSEFEQVDGRTTAICERASGSRDRVEVRVSVEREHRRADGTLVAAGEVASTDDGSVKVA